MTEQDERELYEEGYRDGRRGARIFSNVLAVLALFAWAVIVGYWLAV